MTEALVNTRVQEALRLWGQNKTVATLARVLRECVAGELLLDTSASVIADPAHPFSAGDRLAIGWQVDNAGKRLLLVFTDNERLAAYRGEAPRSLVQPAAAVMAQAVRDFEGVVIDARHADMCIAYSAELARMLGPEPEATRPLATALRERTLPWDELLRLVHGQPVLYIPTVSQRDERGEVTGIRVLTATSPDGQEMAVAFTTPAQAIVWSETVEPYPTTIAAIARVAREDGRSGLVVDPAGDRVVITPEELIAMEQPLAR